MRPDRSYPVKADGGKKTPAPGFDMLIEHAAALVVASSTTGMDEKLARRLFRQANDYMIEAAHSPFFGGTKARISYEGLDIVRELVFERVHDELIRRGYPIPNR